jgi:hypothetical protein
MELEKLVREAKDNLLKYLNEPNGFVIKDATIGQIPEGLTPDIIRDLFEIGLKFGHLCESNKIGFKASLEPLSLVMQFVNAKDNGFGGTDGFVINIAGTGIVHRPSLINLQNGLSMMWSQDIDVSMVPEFIKKVDIYAENNGNKVNGQRVTDYTPAENILSTLN